MGCMYGLKGNVLKHLLRYNFFDLDRPAFGMQDPLASIMVYSLKNKIEKKKKKKQKKEKKGFETKKKKRTKQKKKNFFWRKKKIILVPSLSYFSPPSFYIHTFVKASLEIFLLWLK